MVCAAPARARAQDAPQDDPVQAVLDCGIAGKALSPLAPNVISGHVACAIVLDGFSGDGLAATAWITQADKEGEHRTGRFAAGKGDADDRFTFDPFVRGSDIDPCASFVVHAALMQGDDTAWSTDLPVQVKCEKPPEKIAKKKKPKKITATLTCTYAALDGAVYAWPGNGARKTPKLEDTLACWIAGPKKGGDALTATINGKSEAMWQDDATHAWTSAEMLEEGDDFTPCQGFAVTAEVDDADGQAVWSGKLAIVQRCGDE